MLENNFFEVLIKLLLSVFLGAIIGWEREIKNKGAGLKTHILACMSATLIVLTSFHLFDIYKEVGQAVDPTRIIQGIITGIGFLCAGSIIRNRNSISGLTTAASLWTVTSIGIAIGSGYYEVGVLATLILFFVLTVVRKIEPRMNSNKV